jgi:hypothetical protein
VFELNLLPVSGFPDAHWFLFVYLTSLTLIGGLVIDR